MRERTGPRRAPWTYRLHDASRRRGFGLLVRLAPAALVWAGLSCALAAPAIAAGPTVLSESSSEVRATGARLGALVDPHGEPTECHFQYGAASVTEHEVPCEIEVLAGEEEAVGVTVSGLTQDTLYKYRVLLRNLSSEEAQGPQETLTTGTPEPPAAEQASSITASEATLSGLLNPNHEGTPGSYEFRYRQSASECEGEGEKASAPGSATGAQEPVQAQITGLLPGAPYTFCLRAANEASEEALGPPVTFTTLPSAPTILSESVSSVEATAATLEAQIVPDGASTTYHFEYVSQAQFERNGFSEPMSTPESPPIGTDDGQHHAQARVTGLAPTTTYRYRVAATNSQGIVPGALKTLTTPSAPGSPPETCPNAQLRAEQPYGLQLPECRAYELASPIDTNGDDATFASLSRAGPSRASASGNAVVFTSKGDSFAEPTGSQQFSQFLSRRGAAGWSTQGITPPYLSPDATTHGPAYPTLDFTPELTEGVAATDVPLAADVPEKSPELYLADFATGAYQWVSEQPAYVAEHRQLETGEGFNAMGSSSDLSNVVYDAGIGGFEPRGIFDWHAGEVNRVDVDNLGNPLPGRVGAGYSEGGYQELYTDAWHAVSADGSRVYFTALGPGEHNELRGLYLRENPTAPPSPIENERCVASADACTVQVSASQRTPEDPNATAAARFWAASTDGSRVLFTSNAELTQDALTGAADNAPNLYEYQPAKPVGERLTDLTVDEADPEGAAVLGVVQASDDGSYVYYVANGVLASNTVENGAGPQRAQPGDCKSTEIRASPTARCNLYVRHGATTTFIATLTEADFSDWGATGEQFASPATATASLSPSGSSLAFVSSASLTGYDNQQAQAGDCELGEPSRYGENGSCREVFLYDAETGTLRCPSCNPDGARPIGPADLAVSGGVPALQYKVASFSAPGTLFFDSADALVPADSNHRRDVYAYGNGELRPLSDVSGEDESFLLDVAPSGRDVFIATAEQLVSPAQAAGRIAVYDVREDGGFPAPAERPSCTGDTCQPPPQPLAGVGSPASATFTGAGNLPPHSTPPSKPLTAAELRARRLAKALSACRAKRDPRKRHACEREARKRYGPLPRHTAKLAHRRTAR